MAIKDIAIGGVFGALSGFAAGWLSTKANRDKVAEMATGVGNLVSEKTQGLKEKVQEKKAEVAEKVEEYADSLDKKARELAGVLGTPVETMKKILKRDETVQGCQTKEEAAEQQNS